MSLIKIRAALVGEIVQFTCLEAMKESVPWQLATTAQTGTDPFLHASIVS